MSPDIVLDPVAVQARQDGGYLVSGIFYPAGPLSYQANFAVSMAPDGTYDWARIYMTDSTGLLPSSYLRSVKERTDGRYWAYLSCTSGIGLALLDVDGSPLWHKRYSTPVFGGPSLTLLLGTIVEADNSTTIAASTYYDDYGDALSIVHVDPDGNAVWARTYILNNDKGFFRAFDGSYYGLGSQLIHFGQDGTIDWAKDYGIQFQGFGQLPGGDLLLSTTGPGQDLLRLTTTGTPIGAWVATVDTAQVRLIGLSQDSIFVEHHSYDQGDVWNSLTVAASLDDLDCAFNPAGIPVPTDITLTTVADDTLIVTPDQLKSWTMNVGIGGIPRVLNVQAAGGSAPARPGFNYMVYPHAGNTGGRTSGPLTCTLTFDPLLNYVEAWPPPASVAGNTITWVTTQGLIAFDNEFFSVNLQVPSDVALIGSTLTHTWSVTQDSLETSLLDNAITFTQTITGSYDPNDKLVFPRDLYHIQNDSILDYTIRFQNTGNDTAFTVVVRDTLPLDVDTRTFEMGAASHPYTYSLTGNGILTFTFANILLPDSNTNEPLSHGLVNFRIKPILPLQLGQEITNAADIYFDFNPPIRTPDATVVVTDETGVRPLVKPDQLTVYPVPVKNTLTALLPEGFKPVHAFATGVDGRRLRMVLPPSSAGQVQFATQHLLPGAYVLTLRAQDGRRLSARFVKE
jgi:uncharacterized repeat protein (TIGR01451 family)